MTDMIRGGFLDLTWKGGTANRIAIRPHDIVRFTIGKNGGTRIIMQNGETATCTIEYSSLISLLDDFEKARAEERRDTLQRLVLESTHMSKTIYQPVAQLIDEVDEARERALIEADQAFMASEQFQAQEADLHGLS